MPDERERQQDKDIQRLSVEFAEMSAVLFGRNGSDGFVREVKNGLSEIHRGQAKINERITTLAEEIHSTRSKNDVQEGSIEDLKARLNGCESLVNDLEKEPGERARGFLSWFARAAGYILIGALFSIVLMGISAWVAGISVEVSNNPPIEEIEEGTP